MSRRTSFRSAALLTAAVVLVPLAASVGAAEKTVPQAVNGTSTGPAKAVSSQPGKASSKRLPDMDKIDGPKYSYKDAVVEHALVPSRNGHDTIWVDIIRPKTKPGVKLPTIMDASPYFNTLGRGWEGKCKTPHSLVLHAPGSVAGGCSKTTPFPEFYASYFVPRGYAVALMDLRGTRNTSGCQVYGDRDEVFDAVDVIDHIADQKWSNGKVGLTGGSYDGTLANGAAVEQPISGRHKNAVAAVVPIRAIDRWYDYHFLNGVASQGHAATPALFTAALAGEDTQNSGTDDPLLPARIAERKACIATLGLATDAGYAPTYQDASMPFWTERDFAKDAKGTKAAFFLIHGLYDFNVKMNNTGQMWAALPKGAPKKLWLLNGDHVDPDTPDADHARKGGHILPFTFQQAYRTAVHRWWAQFLKGVPAGALDTPTVEVQGATGTWTGSRSWPVKTTDQVVPLRGGDGQLPYADGAGDAPDSQSVVLAPVKKATRLSGQVVFDLAYTLQGPDTNFAVRIDDLAPGVANDVSVSQNTLEGPVEKAFTISYGWARAFYRSSLKPRGISTPSGGAPVVPGEVTRTSFGSLPLDYVLAPGHRLRLTFSPSEGGTLAANSGGTVTLLTGKGMSSVRLPIAR
ncbi:MAG: CocE/NonD family hydrolase [Frankiaceae bacterium]|nr:CocE/NonD family hydrolase [Frankiaceae bacterium]